MISKNLKENYSYNILLKKKDQLKANKHTKKISQIYKIKS